MNRIALLIAESDTLVDGNYLRLTNQLLARGVGVTLCLMEHLGLHRSRVCALGRDIVTPVLTGEPMPEMQRVWLDEHDAVWVLTLGKRHSFLDKLQLLYSLPTGVRIINSLDAILHLKSKYFIAGRSVIRHPNTWASTRPDELFGIMQAEGGRFIVKPPAASFGRNVFVLTADDPNARVILESMTGVESDEYCLLQRYVEEIRHGEKRVLLAAGEPVGQYLRTAHLDHRTNVEAGAETNACELTPQELEYCREVGKLLVTHGALYVGMDLAYPYVLEFNVINPGGITTIESLTGIDVSARIVDRIISQTDA